MVTVCDVLEYLEERAAQLIDLEHRAINDLTLSMLENSRKEVENIIDWIAEQKDK